MASSRRRRSLAHPHLPRLSLHLGGRRRRSSSSLLLLSSSTLILLVLSSSSFFVHAADNENDFTPYGFQSGGFTGPPSAAPSYENDDSYPGGMVYDPFNHVLYVTGSTYGNYFDGWTHGDNPEGHAHLSRSDCFVGVMRLPDLPEGDVRRDRRLGKREEKGPSSSSLINEEEEVATEGEEGDARRSLSTTIDPRNLIDPTTLPTLLYARRFGTDVRPQTCSALTWLPSGNGSDETKRRVVSWGHAESSGEDGPDLLEELLDDALGGSGGGGGGGDGGGGANGTAEMGGKSYGFALDLDVTLDTTVPIDPTSPTKATLKGGAVLVSADPTPSSTTDPVVTANTRVHYPVASTHSHRFNDAGRRELYTLLLVSDTGHVLNPDYIEFDVSEETNPLLHAHPDFTASGGGGTQRFGTDFYAGVRKYSILTDEEIDANPAPTVTPVTTMELEWEQLFDTQDVPVAQGDKGDVRPSAILYAPSKKNPTDGEVDDDVILFAGTTRGTGNAFGLSASASDLDGFVTKLYPSNGAFHGENEFLPDQQIFAPTYSVRIESNPGRDEIVTAMCGQDPRDLVSGHLEHFYVVGSTTGVMDPEAVDHGDGRSSAFIRKIRVDTLKPLWTKQVEAYLPNASGSGETVFRGDAVGSGCAVSPDGEIVYLAGTIKSGADLRMPQGEIVHSGFTKGGDDVFVAAFEGQDGTFQFARQIGTSRDDVLARGDGAVTTDREGNALLLGQTRGSLMRWRGHDEGVRRDRDRDRDRDRRNAAEEQGVHHNDDAADVFVLSVSRINGAVRSTSEELANGGGSSNPPPSPSTPTPPTTVPPPTVIDVPVQFPTAGNIPDGDETEDDGGGGGLSAAGKAFVSLFVITGAGLIALIVVRSRSGYDYRDMSWKRRDGVVRRCSDDLADLGDVNVEIRASATGGWHGIYDYTSEHELGSGGLEGPPKRGSRRGSVEKEVTATVAELNRRDSKARKKAQEQRGAGEGGIKRRSSFQEKYSDSDAGIVADSLFFDGEDDNVVGDYTAKPNVDDAVFFSTEDDQDGDVDVDDAAYRAAMADAYNRGWLEEGGESGGPDVPVMDAPSGPPQSAFSMPAMGGGDTGGGNLDDDDDDDVYGGEII